MMKIEDLEAELGFSINLIYKNQTNLKKAYKQYKKLEKEYKNGEIDTELGNIYVKMRKNLEVIVKKDVKKAFAFIEIVIYGHGATDIVKIYGNNLQMQDVAVVNETNANILKLMIKCNKDGILLKDLEELTF